MDIQETSRSGIKRRRGRNEGSIYRTRDGLWRASVVTGHSSTGKIERRVVSAKTKTEVLAKLDKLKVAHHSGLLQRPNAQRVGDFLDHWLENVQRQLVRESTYKQNKLVMGHVKRYLGHIKLTNLSAANIQHALGTMEKDEHSARMRQLVRTTLSTALNHAVDTGLVLRNVAQRVKGPRAPRKPIRTLSVEQAENFLKAASKDRYYLIYLVALETGMRIGELLALQWEDVDFEHEFLTVRHTLSKYTLKLEEPKTPQARRRIEVRPTVLSALRQYQEALEANGKLGSFVFTDADGGPIRENNLRRRSFYEIVEQAKLPRMRLHDLRHTHATLLLSAGLNPKIVSERLGHSSIRITLDLYGHVVPSMQKEATQALEELFRPRASAPYATLMLHRVDGEQNGEAHEVLFHGLLSGDADRARTDDLLRDRQAL